MKNLFHIEFFYFYINGKFLQIGTVKLRYILELIRKQEPSKIYQSTIIHM